MTVRNIDSFSDMDCRELIRLEVDSLQMMNPDMTAIDAQFQGRAAHFAECPLQDRCAGLLQNRVGV